MKRKSNLLVTLLLGFIMLFPTSVDAASGNVHRLNGDTRVETSIAVSKESYPGGSSEVVLAGYHGEADALTGTLLAASKDAPLLLIHKFDQTMRSEFNRLGVKTVHLLGGKTALSESLEREIKAAGYNVKRVAGHGRFETAVQVANASAVDTNHVFLTNDGRSGTLADALAIGPVAGRDKDPILLTSKDRLPTETLNALDKMKIKKVTIVGGKNAISDNVQSTLENRDIQVKRVAGYNRWNTAEKIANQYFSGTDKAIVANDGRIGNFADALMGGYLGAKKDAPVLLTESHQMNNETKTFLINQGSSVYLLGGPSVVQNQISDAIDSILMGKEIGDIESNDTFGTSNPLKLGSTINGSVQRDTDKADYFRIAVPTHGHLKLTLRNPDEKTLTTSLYDENQKRIDYDRNSVKTFNKQVKPGTYYLEVGGDNAFGYIGNILLPYELTSSFTPSAYTDEGAGDFYTNATTIDMNDHIKGTIGYGYDKDQNTNDYFKVEIPSEGVFDAVFRTVEGEIKKLIIYDENRNHLNSSVNSDSTTRVSVKPGTYYIRVDNSRRPAASYDLKTSFTPSLNTDEEAGDHFIYATPIAIDEEINGTIGYGYGNKRNKEDYFKIEAPSNGTVEVEIEALENKEVYLDFYDKNQKVLKKQSRITKDTIQLKVSPGTHYIVIGAANNMYGSYTMNTSFNPQ